MEGYRRGQAAVDERTQEGKKTRKRKGKREDAVPIATIVDRRLLAAKGVGARQVQAVE